MPTPTEHTGIYSVPENERREVQTHNIQVITEGVQKLLRSGTFAFNEEPLKVPLPDLWIDGKNNTADQVFLEARVYPETTKTQAGDINIDLILSVNDEEIADRNLLFNYSFSSHVEISSSSLTREGFEGNGFGIALVKNDADIISKIVQDFRLTETAQRIISRGFDTARGENHNLTKAIGNYRKNWSAQQLLEQGFTNDVSVVDHYAVNPRADIPENGKYPKTFIKVWVDKQENIHILPPVPEPEKQSGLLKSLLRRRD